MLCIPYAMMGLYLLLWVVTALLMIITFGYQLARQVAWRTLSEYWEVRGGFRGGKGAANAPPLAASNVFLRT